ncbi:hypothetical protein CONCODRAFT_80136 [Conidiobolus coronatus NRRL 28638]|uniref:SAGA-associated factor 11 n=1 Tax=Conidiobolus coronatus (strain ATCC 28846 / CBS 209.66 / NRRL 28638) TaxID=796925 RepID=A0A137NXS3_CONC2|nr:hypothetical protein CONCODRAFT_80136 [Conidiobolus coronatus NRRL 28638]|eukprot:KXN67478.1 hypothetical protein CONCODRAFT_80136 [Conidiobolus coronatus NRRL 28638]
MESSSIYDFESELMNEFLNGDDSHLQNTDSNQNTVPSLACISFSILNDLVSECLSELVTDVWVEQKKKDLTCLICDFECQTDDYISQTISQINQKNSDSSINCTKCDRKLGAQSYAKHLERCLGLASARYKPLMDTKSNYYSSRNSTPRSQTYNNSEDGGSLAKANLKRKQKSHLSNAYNDSSDDSAHSSSKKKGSRK